MRFAVLLLLFPLLADAQNLDYREHLRLAERFEELGEYLKSAEQYAKAYAAKDKKPEHAYKAAEYFYLVKDYARAAEQYDRIKRDWEDFPLAGLRYARSLKQDSRFEEAVAAYKDYLEYYRGDDRAIVRQIVEQEVRGAAMARQSLSQFQGALVVTPFPPVVNGPADEAAPMPLSAEAVYFLTDRAGGLMRMYRTLRSPAGWQAAEVATQFPVAPGKHIGSGSLNPTSDRFYFGLCDGREVATQPTARCALHVIELRDGRWSTPQPLPSYINTAGNTTAHPYVYREGENEVLLFASDRLDGYGGMDLYRSERRLDSEGTDFTYPENLGPVVNGVGDEVSPHYDPEAKVLHFASNGYLNMGGYDVFRTMGGRSGWNVPANLGAPVNSPADDYYYRPIPGTDEAVLASNRAVRDAKTRTSNEDLFHVRPGSPTLAVRLQVVDSATSRSLDGVTVAAFTREDGRERLVTSARSEDGFFDLELPLGAALELRAQREGYAAVTSRVSVPERPREGFQVPRIRMPRIVVTLADVQELEANRTGAPSGRLPTRPQTSVPQTAPQPTRPAPAPGRAPLTSPRTPAGGQLSGPDPAPTPPPVAAPPVAPPVARTTSTTSAPPPRATPASRTEYRVQIEARREFEPYHRRYIEARGIGELSTDYVESSELYRVLVGRYASRAEAEAALARARRAGWTGAFVAKLEDGVYKGPVR